MTTSSAMPAKSTPTQLTESTSEAHMAASKLMISMVSDLLAVWNHQPARAAGSEVHSRHGAISGPPLRDFPGIGGDDRLWRDLSLVGGRGSAGPLRR